MRLSHARLAVTVVFFGNGAGIGAWAAAVPSVQRQFNLDPPTLGVVLLFLAGGAIAALLMAGGIVGRLGSKQTMRAAVLAFALALPLPLLMPGTGALAVAIALIGFASGTLDVAMNTQGTEVERLRGAAIMSSFHAGFSIGGLAGAVVAGLFGLSVAALLVLLLAVLAGLLGGLPDPPRPAGEPAPRMALPRRSMAGLCLLAAACMTAEGAMADWSGILMRDFAGAPPGFGFAAFSLAMTAGRLGGDALTRRIGAAMTVRMGGLLAAAGLGLGVAWPGIAVSGAGLFLVGLGLANVVPGVFSAAGNTSAVPPATAIAMVSTVGYGGFLLGPPVIGLLAGATGLRAALLAVVGACLAVAALARVLRVR